MDLKDHLPTVIPVTESFIRKLEKRADTTKRLLVNYKDFTFCVVIDENNYVEVLFVYTPSEDYDNRFFRCQLPGKFIKNNEDDGGTIYLDTKKDEN